MWFFLITLGCSSEASRLIAELEHGDAKVRVKAARALSGPRFADNEHVVTALTDAIGDAEPLVQETAITSLRVIGGKARTALPQLEKALTHEQTSVRLAAARAIVRIDPTSEIYQEVLLDSLSAGNAPLFLEVGQMGKNAQWAVPTLVDLLAHRQTYVRALSARALGEIGMTSDEITSALQRRLQDAEPSVRRAAQSALEKLVPSIGPE